MSTVTAKSNLDVFISYRRQISSAMAFSIRKDLVQKGWRVFQDTSDLGKGYFDEALLRNIADAPNFLVILAPGSLDRCSQKDDWLRREIAFALKIHRNVIPVLMQGFVFPNLPEEINDLSRYAGVNDHPDYIEAVIERIITKLVREETESGRLARTAEFERIAKERTEHERRERERERAERLAAERREADRIARQQAEILTPEGRRASARFRGVSIVDANEKKRRAASRSKHLLSGLILVAMVVLAWVLFRDTLIALEQELKKEILPAIGGVVLFVYMVAMFYRSRAQLFDAFADFRQGWWLMGLKSLLEPLRLQPDISLDHKHAAEALRSSGKTHRAATHYYRALWLEYHERHFGRGLDESSSKEIAGLHNELGHVLVTAGDIASAVEHFYIASEFQQDNAKFRGDYEGCPGELKSTAQREIPRAKPAPVVAQAPSQKAASLLPAAATEFARVPALSLKELQERFERHKQLAESVATDGGAKGKEHTSQQVIRGTGIVGRNDPCPCGSGKKYKKCHGFIDWNAAGFGRH